MKGLFGELYSMYGHTIDDYLRKERAKKLIENRCKKYAKQYWSAMMLSDPGMLLLLSHQTSLRRFVTYSAYLAANEAARNK